MRGLSSVHLIVIDEAARVDDDLLATTRPMLAFSNPRCSGRAPVTGPSPYFSTQDGGVRPAVGPAAAAVFALEGTFAELG